jgi:hypothetical protein
VRIRLTITLLALALVVAAPAMAKGPSEATVTGPGLTGGGIHLTSTTGGDPASGTPLGDLTELAGFFPAMYGQVPDPMRNERPSGRLGPKYTVTYTVPGAGTWTIRQDVYPYARPTPVTHMKPGQRFFQSDTTKGGWYVAPRDLRTTLVAAGLPRTAPSGGSGGAGLASWGAASAIVVALLAVLAGLRLAFQRRRLRPAGA